MCNPEVLTAEGTRPRDVVMEVTRGKGAALQVEAAGALPETLPEMLASLGVRGKVVLLGRSAQPATVFFDPVLVAAARIIGSIGHAGETAFPGVIDLMTKGSLDLLPMVTGSVPLERIPALLVLVHLDSGEVHA